MWSIQYTGSTYIWIGIRINSTDCAKLEDVGRSIKHKEMDNMCLEGVALKTGDHKLSLVIIQKVCKDWRKISPPDLSRSIFLIGWSDSMNLLSEHKDTLSQQLFSRNWKCSNQKELMCWTCNLPQHNVASWDNLRPSWKGITLGSEIIVSKNVIECILPVRHMSKLKIWRQMCWMDHASNRPSTRFGKAAADVSSVGSGNTQ